MEAAIKEAMFAGVAENDPSLAIILRLTIDEIVDRKAIFPSPLEEPMFFRRYIRPWVFDSINKLRELEDEKRK